jgi:menaquinone-dependent protoporphyrinogen oxidase
MGRWEKDAQAFLHKHVDLLSTSPLWLFSSGPVGTEKVDKKGRDVLETSRPAEFAEFADVLHPRSAQVFFGLYDPERVGATLGEKLILKVPGMREVLPSGDFRDWPAIEAWAEGIARELKQPVVAAAR